MNIVNKQRTKKNLYAIDDEPKRIEALADMIAGIAQGYRDGLGDSTR